MRQTDANTTKINEIKKSCDESLKLTLKIFSMPKNTCTRLVPFSHWHCICCTAPHLRALCNVYKTDIQFTANPKLNVSVKKSVFVAL